MIRVTIVRATILLSGLIALAGCQQPHGDTLDRMVIGEVMMHSQFADNLRSLCLPGGRLSGSDNARQAAEFVAEKTRAYGLQNVHFEPFEMTGWRVNETTVTVLTDPPTTLDGAVALGYTQSTPPDGITADLIDAGDGKPEDFTRLGDALRGKLVLVRDDHGKRSDKMQTALDHGAAGLVVMEQPNHEPIIGMGHPHPQPEPGVVIRHDDGQKLADDLAAGKPIRLNVKVKADIWDARPDNVVAEIPGRGPLARRVIILCAHLDSWHLAEGAIDNGNGSATILETARALARLNWHPQRTIRFIWFQGEEQNLLGSKAYVAAHAGETDRMDAVINVDMPGAPRTVATSGPPELVAFLKSWRDQMRGYEISPDVGTLGGGSSDHAPFRDAGVNTLSLWGELGPGVSNYHTVGDKYEGVDRRATVHSAAALAVLVRQLADRPE